MRLWLDILFDSYRWYRKMRGGHWECWYVEVCASDVWQQLDACSRETGYRPPCARGTPLCEDYPKPKAG